MAGVQSERVHVMKENFMSHWEQGWGVYEIASHYNLSPCTVYLYLQEIASANGMLREALLKRPRTVLTPRQYEDEAKRTRESVEGLLEELKELGNSYDRFIEKIDHFIEEEEKCSAEW